MRWLLAAILLILLLVPLAEAQALGSTSWWLMMTPPTTHVAYAWAGPFATLSACSQLQMYAQRTSPATFMFTCQYGYNAIGYANGYWVRRTYVAATGGSWFAGPFNDEEDCIETAAFMHATFTNIFECQWRP